MKKILLTGLFGLLNINVYATESPYNVLAEHNTTVEFAPPGIAGIYKFQLLSNGLVQRVDNKNHVTSVTVLSATLTNKFKKAIDSIKTNELKKPDGPMCMDAPSYSIEVRHSDGNHMTIWKRENCREFTPIDGKAVAIVSVLEHLDDVFDEIHRLDQDIARWYEQNFILKYPL